MKTFPYGEVSQECEEVKIWGKGLSVHAAHTHPSTSICTRTRTFSHDGEVSKKDEVNFTCLPTLMFKYQLHQQKERMLMYL